MANITTGCECPEKKQNLGVDNCAPEVGLLSFFAEMDIYNQFGVKNYIDGSKPFDQSCLNDLVQNKDTTQRLRMYPSDIENITRNAEGDQYQTFGSGRKCLVRKGVESREFTIVTNQHVVLAQKINNKTCSEIGFFDVFQCGSIRGVSKDGKIYPYQIENLTATAIDGSKSDTTCNNVVVTFDIKPSKGGDSYDYIYADNVTADILGATGLIDLAYNQTSSVTTATETTIVFSLDTCYGSVGNKIKAKGLTLADLGTINVLRAGALVDVTASAVLVEVDGVYTLVFTPALLPADELQLNMCELLECGYDPGSLTTITII